MLGTIAIILIAIIVIVIVIVLTVLAYNQMLLLNEVNKRLLLLTHNTIEHDRATTEELQDAISQLDAATSNKPSTGDLDNPIPEDEEPFNPHTYNEL